MGRNDYSFRSVWEVHATPDEAFEALGRLDDYPAWWPEVRRADRVDATSYDMVVRSRLPYDLVFRTTRTREDPALRVLEADLDGDLAGFSRWTVTGSSIRSRLLFEERVEARKALLRRLGWVARPAFIANHAVMMRHGRQGLRAYLAGMRRTSSG
jgi:polyketide cyclase/dehydrase/lipid transport protein